MPGRATAAMLVTVATLPGGVRAQDVKQGAAWTVGTELGLNAARGNSSFTIFSSGFRLTHTNRKHFELDWASSMTYGESNSTVIARRMLTSLKFDHNPQATWSPFVFATLERDRIRRLDALSNLGAGLKWTFLRTDRGAASFSAAGIHTYKSIVPLPGASASASVEPKQSTPRISLRPKLVQRWKSGMSIEQIAYWQPVVGDIADQNVEANTRLGFAVSKTSTLFVQYTYRLDSRPPVNVKREDQLMVAGVKLQF